MTQDKQFVLDTMRAQGLAQAQALQEASPEMTGTELYAQEGEEEAETAGETE